MPKTLHSPGQAALIEALIKARKDAGLTQSEVAEKLACQQSLIARVESGQRRVDLNELVIIARVISADPLALVRAVIEAVPLDAKI